MSYLTWRLLKFELNTCYYILNNIIHIERLGLNSGKAGPYNIDKRLSQIVHGLGSR